jgi:hypothetical protein
MEDDRVRQHLEGAGVLSRSMMKGGDRAAF